MNDTWNEGLIKTQVTYTLEVEGHFCLIENVPACVNPETGEQYFSLETVGRLHETILGGASPKRVVQTPVYDYAG